MATEKTDDELCEKELHHRIYTYVIWPYYLRIVLLFAFYAFLSWGLYLLAGQFMSNHYLWDLTTSLLVSRLFVLLLIAACWITASIIFWKIYKVNQREHCIRVKDYYHLINEINNRRFGK